MTIGSIKTLSIAVILIGLTGYSCSSSRLQQGFSYHPKYAGPDMATNISGEKETNILSAADTLIMEPADPVIIPVEIATLTQTGELGNILTREYQAAEINNQPVNSREMIQKMATQYAETQDKKLTNKQLRKLDRYVTKMENKQQRRSGDVHWAPSNNLELFILLGAGVGLVVGILGIGFGWFVFLGLALVYLYFKLLKNN